VIRRRFLRAGAAAIPAMAAAAPWNSATVQRALPRWRGFNLLDLFQAFARERPRTSDDHFRWIRDWGFNFVRVPMDYWLWVDAPWRERRTLDPEEATRIAESALAEVDRLVELGRRFGLHVSLNFHRAPGYCINDGGREPFLLWSDSRAEDAFLYHWEFFARRYREVSEFDLSFNLLNEAPRPRTGYMRREDYRRVMSLAAARIREISPRRLVIVDGLDVGREVAGELVPEGVAQSVHAYWPAEVTHYRAPWVDKDASFPTPSWPLVKPDGTTAGPEALAAIYRPWGDLARSGIGVHCGECGCFNRTPHDVFLAWFEDVLRILAGYGIGWALWNFRGSFGVLDSGRQDVAYEDWHGHQLDRKLLTLLQAY